MNSSILKFLLFNLLLALTITTTLTAIGNYYLDQQEIHSNLDNQLGQTAFLFKGLTEDSINVSNLKDIQSRLDKISDEAKDFLKTKNDTPTELNYEGKYQFQVWDKHNKLLLHSADAPIKPLFGTETGFGDKKIDNISWRVFTIRDTQHQLTFALAQHYDVRNHLTARITQDDIYLMLIIYPISGLLMWFIISRGLRSIKRVANEVAQRAADHLDPVDSKEVPVEMQPLIIELNKLFLRLKQAFEREQRFAADAAHELRTPLAALRTQAQVALKATDSTERQTHLQHVVAGVDRCTHVIQQLLTLCRMTPEAITLEERTAVNLSKLAAEVIAQIAPIAIDKKIDIELIAEEPDSIVMGNATGLHALIRNLVDNAIRYTPEKGKIKVYVSNELEQILLRVVDTGPGIPAELRSRVFERFFRVLGTNTQGSGLGLAIVQQIVKLHNGRVRLSVPSSGIGLEVEVSLPKVV